MIGRRSTVDEIVDAESGGTVCRIGAHNGRGGGDNREKGRSLGLLHDREQSGDRIAGGEIGCADLCRLRRRVDCRLKHDPRVSIGIGNHGDRGRKRRCRIVRLNRECAANYIKTHLAVGYARTRGSGDCHSCGRRISGAHRIRAADGAGRNDGECIEQRRGAHCHRRYRSLADRILHRNYHDGVGGDVCGQQHDRG